MLDATKPPRFIVWRIDSARRIFDSDAAVAEALGLSIDQLASWKEGKAPDPELADRLVGLDAAVEMLSGYLAETSIRKWLAGVNAHLGDRTPLSLLRQGRIGEVIGAIEAEKSGVYA